MEMSKKLADVTTLITRGVQPIYTDDKNGIPIINQRCIRDFRVDYESIRFNNLEKKVIADERFLQKYDILVNATGVGTLGRVAQYTGDFPKVSIDSHVTLVRPNREILNVKFFRYAMFDKQNIIEGMGEGATGQTELSKTRLAQEIEIPFFEMDIQIKIGEILYKYDSLIDNNAKRIKILEEMAQSLYTEWFVNFRFPCHENVKFVESELGEIPESWAVMPFTELIEINPKYRTENPEKPYFEMADVNINTLVLNPSSQTRTSNSGAKFKDRDTILPRISPSLENGKGSYVLGLGENIVGLGSTEFIIFHAPENYKEYVYLLSIGKDFRDNAIKSMVGASGRQRVQNGCFENYKIAVPTHDIAEKFCKIVKPMFTFAYKLRDRNNYLVDSRDLLIPRLLSGEIDVSELSIDVEEDND